MNYRSIVLIQRLVRGHLCRMRLRKLKDKMTLEIVIRLLEEYKTHYNTICELNKYLKRKKIRHSNFPSEISENIVKFIFFRKYNIMPTWDTKSGDLEYMNTTIEVKAFSSKGPTSFGPTEKWNMIYFLDATRFNESIFKVYECKLHNTSCKWQQLKINKKQTYGDQCVQGRRPRIVFSNLYKQLGTDCKLIFNDNLNSLFFKN